MDKSLHHVADLPPAARSAVEGLVGHPLDNDEVLFIATLGVQAERVQTEKNKAWDELESIVGAMQRSASASGLSGEQIDALIDSECAAVRYDHRA